jgi:hypothetical protein
MAVTQHVGEFLAHLCDALEVTQTYDEISHM